MKFYIHLNKLRISFNSNCKILTFNREFQMIEFYKAVLSIGWLWKWHKDLYIGYKRNLKRI